MDGFVHGFLVLCRTQTISYELRMMLNVLEMVMQRASWWVTMVACVLQKWLKCESSKGSGKEGPEDDPAKTLRHLPK